MNIKLISSSNKGLKDAVFLEITEQKESKFIQKENKEFLIFGAGKKSEKSQRKFFLLCRKIIRTAKQNKIKKLVINFDELFEFSKFDKENSLKVAVEQFLIAEFNFDKYKSNKSEDSVEDIFILNANSLNKSLEKGKIVGEEVNKNREISNTPGGDATPEWLAKKAKESCKGTEVKVSILEEKKIKELKMGAILGVAKGSKEKPKFIVMEYKNGGAEKPIVLVGKGVTFDTGGLSLKPSDYMVGMHMDMSGGSVVIHTMAAIGRLKLKKNVIALVPAVENALSGESYRPGDILTSMSGKTVEVLNTDAEGRLIMADALTYAERYKPKLVVDVATLTGASLVALGERCSAIFTKDKKIQDLTEKLGEEVGEYVWPLPLWEEYEEDIKGYFADLSNIHKDNSRYGGAIEAATFLYQFAKKYPWMHIDMAPRMTPHKSDLLSPGATGEPMKLLLKLVEEYK